MPYSKVAYVCVLLLARVRRPYRRLSLASGIANHARGTSAAVAEGGVCGLSLDAEGSNSAFCFIHPSA
jgi:hypothetical protein